MLTIAHIDKNVLVFLSIFKFYIYRAITLSILIEKNKDS